MTDSESVTGISTPSSPVVFYKCLIEKKNNVRIIFLHWIPANIMSCQQ